MKKIYLTKEQLGRVVTNILRESSTTDITSAALEPVDKKTIIKNPKGPKSLGPTGSGPSVGVGSPNQAATSSGGQTNTPNTTGNSVAGLNDMFSPSFTDDIGYDKSISNNMEYQQPTDFKGENPTYLPGTSNDKAANLKLTGDFGYDGVTLNTMSGEYDIKLGKQFTKDMKKGKVYKKAKQQHASLHPNRHKNSAKITNTVHPNAITRGGVTFDSSFKAGKGGDPFTIKTS